MTTRASVCGHIAVDPPLNAAEFEYLTAFALSRRHAGRGGPYVVPGNPAAEVRSALDRTGGDGSFITPVAAQPALWCPWQPACGGSCLVLCDEEGISAPVAWLRYLAEHFLSPAALSSDSGLADFAGFTFDHQLGGAVALHDAATGELSLIRPRGDAIAHEILSVVDPDR